MRGKNQYPNAQSMRQKEIETIEQTFLLSPYQHKQQWENGFTFVHESVNPYSVYTHNVILYDTVIE